VNNYTKITLDEGRPFDVANIEMAAS